MEDLNVLASALNKATTKGAFNLDEAVTISRSISNVLQMINKCEKCENLKEEKMSQI